MYSDYKNKMFLDKFFEKHKVFSCKNLDYDLGNNNVRTRIKYLFSEYGFFNYILKENTQLAEKCKCIFINDCSHHNPYRYKGDNPNLHNQQRYICQEVIDDNIFNPIHVSLKSKSKRKTYNLSSIDYSKNSKRTLIITIHPGHTRMFASSFLKRNLTNSLIYVNKKNYYENMLKGDLEEITNINQLFPLWKPYKKVNPDLLYFNFKFEQDKKSTFDIDLLPITLHGSLKNCSNKYHKETDSFVLKLWNLKYIEKSIEEDMLHTPHYLQEIYNSSWNISKILFEKKLTIYTNSKEDVKKYFLDIRKNLIKKAKNMNRYSCKVDIKKDFDFDVVVVEDKPNDISKLNENKGFAIWIDKSILKDINREIYEFVVFTRHDIKLSETEDGKISITNCKNIGDKKWIIHKEFYS